MPAYPQQTFSDLKNPTFISFLDMMRWMAALIVFLGHLRMPLLMGYGDLSAADQTLFVKAWYFLSGMGHQAIIIFFVLSGYLVGGIALARVKNGAFQFDSYLVDRLTRLYIVLIPALALTFILDNIGASLFADTGFYNAQHPQMSKMLHGVAITEVAGLDILLANLAMLQPFHVAPLGSNIPLWSLSYEFWFYIIFALGLSAFLTSSKPYRLACLAIIIATFVFFGIRLPLMMGLWLVGAAVALLPWRKLEKPRTALLLFLLTAILVRAKAHDLSTLPNLKMASNYLMATSFAWLVLSMRHQKQALLEKLAPLNKKLADFSFSLYLIHFPVMLFMLGLLHKTGLFPALSTGYSPLSPTAIGLYIALTLLVYLTAYLFSQLTEMQTWKLRKRIKQALHAQLGGKIILQTKNQK